MSRETVIVVDAVADAVAAESAKRAGSLTTGQPDELVHLASADGRESIDPVADRVDEAISKGDRLLADGVPECSMIVSETVSNEIAAEMGIHSTESSGPLTAFFRARIKHHAIGIACDRKRVPAGPVAVRDVRHEPDVTCCMQTGIARVNGPKAGDEVRVPVGGSGYRRFGGFADVDALAERRRAKLETSDSDERS